MALNPNVPNRWKPLAVLAREVGISPRQLREAVQRGELDHARPGARVVLSTDSAVDTWLRSRRVPESITPETQE